jgi:LPXTG-motif cell wall-anchored protein
MTLPKGWDSKKSNVSSGSPSRTSTGWDNKTLIFVIIGIVLGVLGAFFILNMVLTAQDNMDKAGLRFTKMDKGLLY